MNIGFDLDGIFIDKPPFVPRGLIERLYRGPQNHELKYRFPSTRFEQEVRRFSHHSFLRPRISRNIQFLNHFSKNPKNKIYLISSRFSFLKQRTEKVIQKYKFDKIFNGVFFNFEDRQPHIFKNEVIKKLKLDLFADDDLPLLNFLSEQNQQVVFYWFNRDQKARLKKNLFAITQLSDILI